MNPTSLGRVRPSALTLLTPLTLAGTLCAQSTLYTFYGDDLGDAFVLGRSAGDVDADGTPDLIVGALADDDQAPDGGSARVFSGATGAILFTFYGQVPDANFGNAVASAGDVNGDGHADLIVGAPLDDTAGSLAGRAQVFSGLDGSLLYDFLGSGNYAALGNAVAGVGDWNADGYDDFAIGSMGDSTTSSTAGRVRVHSGRDAAVLLEVFGAQAGDFFGSALDGDGDIDADGTRDLIVGALYADTPQGPNSGRVYVFSGATGVLLHSLEGQASGDWLGGSVASAGDHDGDGFDDFAVATWGDDTGAHDGGAVRVHSGRTGAVLLAIFGDVDSEALGIRMDAGGDFDGDGTPDLALAAPDLNPSSTDSGRLLLYSGRDASLLFVLDGQEDGDFFPGPISFLGDLDGDGKDELSVGAIGGLDLFGQATGWVKVFAGSAALGTRFCTAAPNSSGLGAELVARGSDRVSSDALQLEAAPIPAGSGSFFYGSTTLQLPFGDGYRCVGGALGRIATVQSSGGLLRVEVQLSAPSSVATTIAAGSTWNFQALYLDPQAGGAGFNLTDAVSILFRP